MGVIVGSILLAFAIDAGWDARGDAKDEAVVLAALRSEMESTVERIDDRLERRARYSETLTAFLESSPSALADLPPDSARDLMRSLVSFSAFTVSADRVQSANVASLDDVELRVRLGEWIAAADNVAEDAPVLIARGLELADLSGLAGGPRAMSQFDFPEVPGPNIGLSRLRQEGRFVDALLVFNGMEQNNLRKIRVLRRYSLAVLDRLQPEQP